MKFLATARHAAASLSRATVIAGAVVCALAAPPAQALDVYVRVGQFTQIMPDGTSVPMWGYRIANSATAALNANVSPSSPGPAITVPPNDSTLNVHLFNRLSVPTSFVLHGQNAVMTPVFKTNATVNDLNDASCTPGTDLACRVRSFTKETPPNNATAVVYTFTDVKPGTYLYQSGTLPQLQVQMGLYGMMRKNAPPTAESANNAYEGVPYDNEISLLLSEVDPVVHAKVAAGTFSGSTLAYDPKYFRLHRYGPAALAVPAEETASTSNGPLGIAPGQRQLLRMLNAGLQSRSLVLSDGHWFLMAEDGNAYPYPREQSTAFLAAAKTADVWMKPTVGNASQVDRLLTVFDHNLGLSSHTADPVGGMLFQMRIATTLLPTLDISTCPLTGVQGVAYGCTVTSAGTGTQSYSLDIAPVGMGIDSATGVINWIPTNEQAQRPADMTVTNALRVRATDANGGVAVSPVVQIAVTNTDDAPLAVNDAYTVRGGTLTVTDPLLGVRANDSDPDGDPLGTVTVVALPGTTGDSLALNADGTFTFTAGTYAEDRTATFTYTVAAGALTSNVGTVTLNVKANVAPTAVEDTVAIVFNAVPQPLYIDVLVNDYDIDGNFDPAVLTNLRIPGPPNRGGTATRTTTGCPVAGRACILYTPPLGFRGTETLTYRIVDTLGAVSVAAPVRINIQ